MRRIASAALLIVALLVAGCGGGWGFAATATPQLASPDNGAQVSDPNVLLAWNEVIDATNYTVEISTGGVVIWTRDITATATSYHYGLNTDGSADGAPALVNGTTYSWRVQGRSSSLPAGWSSTRTFTKVP